jgi:hypothetical protein
MLHLVRNNVARTVGRLVTIYKRAKKFVDVVNAMDITMMQETVRLDKKEDYSIKW